VAGIVREGLLEEENLNLGLGRDWNGKGILSRRNSPAKSPEEEKHKYVQGTGGRLAWLVGEVVQGTTKLKAN